MTDYEIMCQLSQAVRDDDLLTAEELTNVQLWLQAGFAEAVDPARWGTHARVVATEAGVDLADY